MSTAASFAAPTPASARSPQAAGLLLALALHALLGGLAWFFPPALNSDSATGFLVWDASRHGASFNHMLTPDPADIERDASVFQAWWSPGQYLVVAPWMELGLSLGHAIAWGSWFATALSLWGYWRMFRAFEFDAHTSGVAVLVVACNWTFTRPYGDYLGGELALFTVLPWLVLLTRAVLRHAGAWVPWLALPALYWCGNMAKNSYIPMAAGLVAGLRGRAWWEQNRGLGARAGELLRWLAWLALGHALLWATYLRLGTNPSIRTGGGSHPAWWQATLELIAFPITGIFSTGNILGRIFLHPSHPRVASMAELWPIELLLAFVAVILVAWIFRREARERPDYAWLLGGVLAAYAGFFLALLVLGSAAGWEERMFKPAGFLLVAPLVAGVRAERGSWRARLVTLALMVGCAYGVFAAANRALYLHRLDNVGRRGITQHVLSREALQVLHQLDATLPAGALVVVPSPEMALELQRTRAMPTHAAMQGLDHIAATPLHGRVGDLVLLVDTRMIAAGKAAVLAATFKSYAPDAWRVHRYGEWEFWHQGSFAGWPPETR